MSPRPHGRAGRAAAALLAVALLAAPRLGLAQTPDPTTVFAGRAQTGPDQRDIRVVITCSTTRTASATGALSIELYVPHHEELAPAFDFDSLEGPDANAGKRTDIETRTVAGAASGDFAVSGWVGVDADAPFGLGLTAAVRGEPARLAAVARLLRPLTQGAGQLVWHQGNPREGGTPIVATLTLTQADAARLRTIVPPCLALAK